MRRILLAQKEVFLTVSRQRLAVFEVLTEVFLSKFASKKVCGNLRHFTENALRRNLYRTTRRLSTECGLRRNVEHAVLASVYWTYSSWLEVHYQRGQTLAESPDTDTSRSRFVLRFHPLPRCCVPSGSGRRYGLSA